MSGANQHYIPQMLLKNFVDKNLPQKKQAYKYDKHSGVFTKSIKKIASASYFNQDDAGNNADDEITKYENSIGLYFNHFLNKNSDEEIDNIFCAKLVTHLILRTSHFRDVFFEKTFEGIDNIISLLFKDEFLIKMMKSSKGKEIFFEEIERFKIHIPQEIHYLVDAIANNDDFRIKAIESINDEFFTNLRRTMADEVKKGLMNSKKK